MTTVTEGRLYLLLLLPVGNLSGSSPRFAHGLWSHSPLRSQGRGPRQRYSISRELTALKRPNLSDTQILSENLCELLLAKRQKKNTPNQQNDDSKQIQALVEKLIAAEVVFDPVECLDGNSLFVSTVVDGPTPLWETIGQNFWDNIQGQKYTYTDEEKSVVNYAEVFGPAFHLRAFGTYETSEPSEDIPLEKEPIANPLSTLLASFASPSLSQRKLLQCPVDFTVKVNRASFRLLGQSIGVPIAGTGYLRVLYADPKLRIFVSPRSTTDDRWEKSGLLVAQIRADMVRPSFEWTD